LTGGSSLAHSAAVIELLTPQQMAEADRLTIAAGTPGHVLMERAGIAVADAVSRAHAHGSRVAILCGPGNNGGDGYVAARVLRQRGFRVTVAADGPPRAGSDAALAAGQWGGPVVPLGDWRKDNPGSVVDALYGAGLVRDIEGAAAEAIAALNASGCRIVAVDVPSGVDGGTGEVRGIAVRAEETVTFHRRKPGHLLLPGRLHCGAVRVADIGIAGETAAAVGAQAFANEPALWRAHLPVPRVDGHKYTRGHAVVASGGMTSTGAARLAARGALRAGAGLVTIASPPEALAVNAAPITGAMPCASAPGLVLAARRARWSPRRWRAGLPSCSTPMP
jgi:hydroxyethylthiazole kinase-like uncharacterized protein yjeF